MSNRISSFNEIINKELKNRFEVFCNGNSGCDSFCPIHHNLKQDEEFLYINNKNIQNELEILEKQCENCIVKKFIEFCET